MSKFAGPIYPVPIKPASDIYTWDKWPDDVRDTLRWWNRRKRKKGLSFSSRGVFKCWDCDQFCRAHTYGGAVIALKETVCDDCLIARARAYLAENGQEGRP